MGLIRVIRVITKGYHKDYHQGLLDLLRLLRLLDSVDEMPRSEAHETR